MSNLLSRGLAPATKAVYRRAYLNYQNFHTKFYPHKNIFPIQPLHITQFIAFGLKQGLKGSSIQTQVAGVNYMNRMMGHSNIADNFIVKKILRATQKLTQTQDKRLPITISILKALPRALSNTVLSGYDHTLYQAMFLTAFFALLRIGELTTTQFGTANVIQYSHVELVNNKAGLSHILIHMRQHKHSQGTPLPITLARQKDSNLCPVHAISTYLVMRGTQPGPLFISREGLPVSSKQFAATLRECIICLGLDPNKYTSHAFRIGGTCYAHQNNFSDTQLKQLGRWNSSAYTKYIRGPTLALNTPP